MCAHKALALLGGLCHMGTGLCAYLSTCMNTPVITPPHMITHVLTHLLTHLLTPTHPHLPICLPLLTPANHETVFNTNSEPVHLFLVCLFGNTPCILLGHMWPNGGGECCVLLVMVGWHLCRFDAVSLILPNSSLSPLGTLQT